MSADVIDLRLPSIGSAPPEPTIEDVRRAIPEGCYRSTTARGLSIVVRDIVGYAMTMAALFVVHSPLVSIPLILLAGLFVSAMFVSAHDAAHGALVPGRRLNRWVAFALMLPSLHVREAWEFGHNRVHHGFTVREGMDFVWHPLTVEQFARLGRLARLRHRLEWSFIGSGAYYLREVWWNKMMRFDPPARFAARIKRDRRLLLAATGAVTAGVAAAGWWQGGSVVWAAWTVLKLIVVPFVVFTYVIGWTVHVHHIQPDTKWYSSKQWSKYRGQMLGTTILRIPRLLDLFFHDIFVHVPHHVDMRIPCYRLRRAATAITDAFPHMIVDRKLRLRDYLSATRQCKLYDFDGGRWLRYDAVGATPRD